MLGASACVRSLRLFTCVQYNQLATPRRHVAYNLKWSVFMIMTGMGNPFLTTVSCMGKLITLDTPGSGISCVLFPNLISTWAKTSHHVAEISTQTNLSDRLIHIQTTLCVNRKISSGQNCFCIIDFFCHMSWNIHPCENVSGNLRKCITSGNVFT